ncbi:MAG: TetR/AcrR family transcriptional regulator [Butyricicoccus sp.]|nr:TetR/AcrR family transcriptional regulator [Butyricicoccus sp.]
MARKRGSNTKGKIVSTAWRLFYEQGYDDTTVEEIIIESGTSRGSFYHYFEGKDALLSSLSYLFDEKYEALMPTIDPDMNSFDKLMYLNRELFGMIEDTVPFELLSRLYSSQLITRGEKHMLDQSRTYYKLLRQIVTEGQQRGEIANDLSAKEIARIYAITERGMMYDWCISGGNYSLRGYAADMLPRLMRAFRR